MDFSHKSVLLEETIEGLNVRKEKIYLDGTLGGAGHSYEILKKLNGTGLLIGIVAQKVFPAVGLSGKNFLNIG